MVVEEEEEAAAAAVAVVAAADAENTTTEDLTEVLNVDLNGDMIGTKTMSTNTGGDHHHHTTAATDPGQGPVHTVQGVTD